MSVYITTILYNLIVDCGLPIIGNVAYNSTLEGSTLLFLCEDNRTMSAMCDKSGKWIPDPDDANVCLSASMY